MGIKTEDIKMVSSTNYNVAINPNMSSSMGVSNAVKVASQPQKREEKLAVKSAKIKYSKIKSSDKHAVYGDWKQDYVYEVVKEITNSPEMNELRSRYRLITFKNPISKSLYLNSCYKIDFIEAPQRYQGEGTKVVKALVERSLADKDTQGRVVVNAEIIDEKTSPAGFFYKLGFRFVDSQMNEVMEKWVREKTLVNAPKLTGMMYLPKENINRVIMYGENLL